MKINNKKFWSKINKLKEDFVKKQVLLCGYECDKNYFLIYIDMLWEDCVHFVVEKRMDDFEPVDYCIVMGMAMKLLDYKAIKADKSLNEQKKEITQSKVISCAKLLKAN